jgi:hypothetical protein
MDPRNWNRCVELVETLKTSRYKWMIAVKEILIDNQKIYNNDQKKYLLSVKRKPNFFYHLLNNKLDNKKFTVTHSNGRIEKIEYNTILVNEWNHFKGWECNLGVDSIFIDYIGRVSGTCGEYLYGKDFYYNMHDLDFANKFNPEIKSVICSKDGCFCAPEVVLKKRKVIPIKSVLLEEYPLHKYSNL